MTLPDNILEVVVILRSLNCSAHCVGGAVRDDLLGESTKDLDFVTDAPYEVMAEAFKEAGWTIGRKR